MVPGSQPQDSETWDDDAHWTEAKAAVFSIQYVNYFNYFIQIYSLQLKQKL